MHQTQQEQPYLKPLTSSSMSSSYFAPIQSQVNMKETMLVKESEHLGDHEEKLSNLHSRLHQEADKIRKWKTHTEMEIQQKDRKISEVNLTVESLRKSILELQLQNESLSLKLNEEITNREEILQKIEVTRNMCSILKEYAEKLEDRMMKCETQRTELKYWEKEHIQNYETLTDQFNELQTVSVDNYDRLSKEVEEEKEAKKIIERKYKQQISDAEKELKKLLALSAEKEGAIETMSSKVEGNEKQIMELVKDRDELQEKLESAAKIADNQLQVLEEKSVSLKTVQQDKDKLNAELEELSSELKNLTLDKDSLAKNFNDTEQLYMMKLEQTQAEVCLYQQKLKGTDDMIAMLQENLRQAQQSVEELKSAKDILQLEKAEHEVSIKELLEVRESLQGQLSVMNQQLKDMSSTTTEKDGNLQQLRASNTELNDQLLMVTNQLAESKKSLKLSEAQLKKVDKQLNSEKKECENMIERINGLETELEESKTENSALREELKTVAEEKDELMNEKNKLEETLTGVTLEVKELKGNASKLEDEVSLITEESDSKLQEELQTIQTLKDELEASRKQTDDKDTKIKTLKQDITAKNKQIKELEKDVKSAKREVNSKVKVSSSLEDKLETLQTELDETNSSLEKMEEEKQALSETVSEKEEEKDKLNKKMLELQEQAKFAIKDKEAAQKELDVSGRMMANTMNDFKKQHDEILEQNKKRIEEIEAERIEKMKELNDKLKTCKDEKDCIDKLESELAEKVEQLLKLEESNAELQADSESKEKDLSCLSNREKEKEEKIHELEEELKFKDIENEALKVQVSLSAQKSKLLATPKLPKPSFEERMSTPLMKSRLPTVSKTPVSVKVNAAPAKTPASVSRILQQQVSNSSSIPKRRKVAFSRSNPGSDSSDSENMEVDLNEVSRRMSGGLAKKSAVTPLIRRATPKIHVEEDLESPYLGQKLKQVPRGPPLKLVPRGPPLKAVARGGGTTTPKGSAKSKAVTVSENLSKEKDKFNELFPEVVEDKQAQKKTGNEGNVGTLRKTPSKAPGKFFKSTQREKQRMTKAGRSQKDNSSWVDLDSVFGFGSED